MGNGSFSEKSIKKPVVYKAQSDNSFKHVFQISYTLKPTDGILIIKNGSKKSLCHCEADKIFKQTEGLSSVKFINDTL